MVKCISYIIKNDIPSRHQIFRSIICRNHPDVEVDARISCFHDNDSDRLSATKKDRKTSSSVLWSSMNLFIYYALIHFKISLVVAFFPYMNIPTLNNLPASFINTHMLTINIASAIMISIHGHSCSIDRRNIKIPSDVNGIYVPT